MYAGTNLCCATDWRNGHWVVRDITSISSLQLPRLLCNMTQYGGMAMFSFNNAACRVMGSGWDTTGLGRWTWTRFWGWNGIITHVICACRQCTPTGSNKVFSVYAQHQRYFNEQLEDICPQTAFIRDLCAELDMWIEQGEQLIVALDANEDMQSSPVATAFQTHNLWKFFWHIMGKMLHQLWTMGQQRLMASGQHHPLALSTEGI